MTEKKKNDNLFTRLSNNAKGILILSSELSKSIVDGIDTPVKAEHLFVAVLLTPQSIANKVLISMGVKPLEVIKSFGYSKFLESKLPDNFKDQIKNVLHEEKVVQEESKQELDLDTLDQELNDILDGMTEEEANSITPGTSVGGIENVMQTQNDLGGLDYSLKESYEKVLSGGRHIIPGDIISKDIMLSEGAISVLSKAYQIANRYEHVYVGSEHLILAMLSMTDNSFTKKLHGIGLTYDGFVKTLGSIASYPVGLLVKPDSTNKDLQSTQFFTQVGVDLVEQAKQGIFDPLVGREKELEQLINVLSRRKKNNPIIVGDSGVGKTALVEGLAQKIAIGEVPGSLLNIHIISIDIPGIVAGSKLRGDVEEKVMMLVEQVKSRKDVIVFIDEIQNIVQSGMPSGGMDIASILKPALVNGAFRCIGATTREDFTRYFEEDNALARRFQSVFIDEPSVAESILILKKIKPVLEKHHNISISDEALEAAVKLSDRFVSDRYLPDKAIDLLDEAAASRRIEVEVKYRTVTDEGEKLQKLVKEKESAVKIGDFDKATSLREEESILRKKLERSERSRDKVQKSEKYLVSIDTIRKIISKWTGIPIETIDKDQVNIIINLEDGLQNKIIGQKEAIKKVSSAIKRARAGISSPDRPWASFLFLGPTGVGKTELAKILTEKLFGDEDRLIQIDMSELMEMHSVSKLIGSPPGYVGFREGGMLTEQVKEHPYSVILFDEIEKAHNDVLNVLLQILEYGHLTDGRGKKVNFKNTVIILTSNIGAEEIRKNKVLGFVSDKSSTSGGFAGIGDDNSRSDKSIEDAYDSMKNSLTKKLKESIRPELLNRLDDIVIFRSLTRKDARQIVLLLVEELNNRLVEKNVKVELDKKVVDYIVKEGFNEEYGARPLRRVLQDKLESKLADYILKKGEVELRKNDGLLVLNADIVKGELRLESSTKIHLPAGRHGASSVLNSKH
jgi:ATP-dependent Clp protease ATP-binding subunit ClpC